MLYSEQQYGYWTGYHCTTLGSQRSIRTQDSFPSQGCDGIKGGQVGTEPSLYLVLTAAVSPLRSLPQC